MIIKETNEYYVKQIGDVYRIHFYSDEDRTKAINMKSIVTKNLDIARRYL